MMTQPKGGRPVRSSPMTKDKEDDTGCRSRAQDKDKDDTGWAAIGKGNFRLAIAIGEVPKE